MLFNFFKKGNLSKFYLNNENRIIDLDLENAVNILKADEDTKREDINKNFYDLLKENKVKFENLFHSKDNEPTKRRSKNEKKLRDILMGLKNFPKFTELKINKINKFIDEVDKGTIPKKTLKRIFSKLDSLDEDHFIIFQVIKENIDVSLFKIRVKSKEIKNLKKLYYLTI